MLEHLCVIDNREKKRKYGLTKFFLVLSLEALSFDFITKKKKKHHFYCDYCHIIGYVFRKYFTKIIFDVFLLIDYNFDGNLGRKLAIFLVFYRFN